MPCDQAGCWETGQGLTPHARSVALGRAQVGLGFVRGSPPGLALRCVRVKRYRTDKAPAEPDTFDTIRAIFRQTTGLEPPAR